MKFSRSPSSSKTSLKPKNQKTQQKREPVPQILMSDRCFSGNLIVQNSSIENISSIQIPDSITSLIISNNPISTFIGFPSLPKLTNLEFEKTNISNLNGLPLLPCLRSVKYNGTPFNIKSTSRLAFILSQTPVLHVINSTIITQPERQQANQYPQGCTQLVRKGWIPTIPPPTPTEVEQINAKIVEKRKTERVRVSKTTKNPPVLKCKESELIQKELDKQQDEIQKLQKQIELLQKAKK